MKSFEEYKQARNRIIRKGEGKRRSYHEPKDYPSKYPKEATLCTMCKTPLFVINPATGGKHITRPYYHIRYTGTPISLSLCYRADTCYNSYISNIKKEGE